MDDTFLCEKDPTKPRIVSEGIAHRGTFHASYWSDPICGVNPRQFAISFNFLILWFWSGGHAPISSSVSLTSLRQLVLRRRQIENGSWFELVNWLRSELSLQAWASQTSQWWHISDSSTYLSLDVPPSWQICIEKPRCSTKSQRLERISISLRRNLVSFRELGLTEDSAMKHKKPK